LRKIAVGKTDSNLLWFGITPNSAHARTFRLKSGQDPLTTQQMKGKILDRLLQ